MSYRHILRIQIVERVHVAADMKQVTLHGIHTHLLMHASTHKHKPIYALQVCSCKILIFLVIPVVSAYTPISALTCFSSSDTHTNSHTLPALSAAAAACCYGNPQHSTGQPMFSRTEKTPMSDHVCRSMCLCIKINSVLLCVLVFSLF